MALAAKSLQRILESQGLWQQGIWQKYVDPLSFEEWVRFPVKHILNVPIIQKALIQSFPLLSNWLAWRIGNGDKVRIGADPWIGCAALYRLPVAMIETLHNKGVFTIAGAADPIQTSLWHQGWKSAHHLGLQG